MNEPWVTNIKDGYRTKTIQIGNCTVTVHRPILDAAEQARRENQLKDALIQFGRSINHE